MTHEQEKEFKKDNWYFENQDLWNSDAEVLNPLKTFLKAFLQEPVPPPPSQTMQT